MADTGTNNLITDIPGLRIGNAEDTDVRTGVTVILPDNRVVAAYDVRGGGPGTIETDALEPHNMVERIDAIVLAGGSALGLRAASGVQDWLRDNNRGYPIGPETAPFERIPIVPGAILFDLLNGGDKDWKDASPYPALGRTACEAADHQFKLGSVGAGFGATTFNLKGGLGSASELTGSGFLVGALAVVNAVGSATMGDSRHFWAAPFEIGNEFGGLGFPVELPEHARAFRHKARPHENTTLAVVATDADLTPAQAKRVAAMAHDGMARALHPVHTPYDGDIVFCLATGGKPITNPPEDLAAIGTSAAHAVARSIARGIFHASALAGDAQPAWQSRFGKPD
jgi:L-aminopeptidase/D-esterase-like protein